MRKLSPLLLVFALGGCATVSPYGSFLPENHQAIETAVAQDAVTQITALYPPAKTRVVLQHAATDPFGISLTDGLRNAGYALVEFSANPTGQAAEAGEPLRYVLDQAGDNNLYRLTVQIGNQSISRLYNSTGGNIAPAGYWARKE